MKTLISTLIVLLLLSAGCSKDSNPITSPIAPADPNGTLVYEHPDGSPLTGLPSMVFDKDSLIITYSQKRNYIIPDTAAIWSVKLIHWDSTHTYASEIALPFTNDTLNHSFRYSVPEKIKLYNPYIYANHGKAVFTSLKFYKK